MGWRYRKSFRLFPGVRINVSRRGVSTTIGVRGASVNLGPRGVYLNTGIPGTGIYNRQRIDIPNATPHTQVPVQSFTPLFDPATPDISYYKLSELPLPGAIQSADVETLTSNGLKDFGALIARAIAEKHALQDEHRQKNAELVGVHRYETELAQRFLGKWLNKKKIALAQTEIARLEEYVAELEEQLRLCVVPMDLELDETLATAYQNLTTAFHEVATCQSIWDKTSSMANDPRVTRSAATSTVTRRRVEFTNSGIEIIPSNIAPCRLENANGNDIYLYPGFILVYENTVNFALIDWRDLHIELRHTQFIEDETVPSDSTIVDTTWRYVNKNGTPDRRFIDNRQLPIVVYSDIYLTTPRGLHEAYTVSNPEKAERFVEAVTAYQLMFSAAQ